MKFDKSVLKETFVTVFSGLAVNYPLSLFIMWLLIDVLDITSSGAIATISTVIFTVVALVRVYYVRIHFENKKG